MSPWNLPMSSSIKLIHASIPPLVPLLSMKRIRFLKGRLADPTHIGFPHPKSASYKGNLQKLVKRNDYLSFSESFSSLFQEIQVLYDLSKFFLCNLHRFFLLLLSWFTRAWHCPSFIPSMLGVVIANRTIFPK